MKEVGQCAQCGGSLAESGRCTACGADQVILTSTNIGTFIDRIKQFVVLPGINKPKYGLGELSLVNKQSNQTYPLKEPVVKIGREPTNEVPILNDTSISRNHACVMFLKDGFWIEDLGSTNGTFVNGKKLSGRKQVYQGDHIVLGKTELVIVPVENGQSGFREYEIVQEVGRGGMGVVYKAIDHKHRRTVAIKQLVLHNVEPLRQKARSERFRREATLAQRLNHPNIVPVYDVHLGPENFYYVMEFLEGHSLRKEMETRGGRLTAREYMPILEQIASALQYAHSKSVVHRDVKPDNIFIMPDGSVRLTDFGIARIVEELDEANLTRSGAMLGTLAYAAPEQLNNAKKVDHKADIFSLGIVTYEALSGVSPFQGNGITDTVVQIASAREKPLCELVPGINPDTSAVVAKSMAKKAADRHRSVSDFSDQFRKSLESEDTVS
jgi:serine/threonine protein kinase